MLAGAHWGIANKAKADAATDGNAYERPGAPLPTDWNDAIRAFDAATVLPDYLGAEFCRVFSLGRKAERGDHLLFDPLPNRRRGIADLVRGQGDSDHRGSPFSPILGKPARGNIDADQSRELENSGLPFSGAVWQGSSRGTAA